MCSLHTAGSREPRKEYSCYSPFVCHWLWLHLLISKQPTIDIPLHYFLWIRFWAYPVLSIELSLQISRSHSELPIALLSENVRKVELFFGRLSCLYLVLVRISGTFPSMREVLGTLYFTKITVACQWNLFTSSVKFSSFQFPINTLQSVYLDGIVLSVSDCNFFIENCVLK